LFFQVSHKASKTRFVDDTYSRHCQRGIRSDASSRPDGAVDDSADTVVGVNKRWRRGMVWSSDFPVLDAL